MSEDASLDDFFAKKDRSKKKQKNKIKYGDPTTTTPTDENNSQSFIQSKDKPVTQKKDKDKLQSGVARSNTPTQDEEWNDFEEKTEKDYTGLRIQNIQISKRVESENETEQREGGDDENGEDGDEKGEVNIGPWNKTAVHPDPTPPPPEPVAVKAPPDPAGPKKYVPPGMRNQPQESSKRPMPRRGKKGAPDLKNEEEFPTLGTAAPTPEWEAKVATFEPVRTGGRRVDESTVTDSCHLTLQNKFSALS